MMAMWWLVIFITAGSAAPQPAFHVIHGPYPTETACQVAAPEPLRGLRAVLCTRDWKLTVAIEQAWEGRPR